MRDVAGVQIGFVNGVRMSLYTYTHSELGTMPMIACSARNQVFSIYIRYTVCSENQHVFFSWQ